MSKIIYRSPSIHDWVKSSKTQLYIQKDHILRPRYIGPKGDVFWGLPKFTETLSRTHT